MSIARRGREHRREIRMDDPQPNYYEVSPRTDRRSRRAPEPPAHAPRTASAREIAAAEVEHRIRFPARYGLKPHEVEAMKADRPAAIEARIAASRGGSR